MKKTYKVNLKKPRANHVVWAGPNSMNGVISTPEDDKTKTRRVALENMLKNIVGEKEVVWNQRGYFYTVELTEKQVKKVSSWNMVRTVIEKV